MKSKQPPGLRQLREVRQQLAAVRRTIPARQEDWTPADRERVEAVYQEFLRLRPWIEHWGLGADWPLADGLFRMLKGG